MTIIWCMVPEIWSLMDRMFCHFGPFFTLLPPKNPKNHNFEKKRKKTLEDIILHKCAKNHDHMLRCSWDRMRDGCNSYFLFWAIFCPFNSQRPKKSKFRKNEKNATDRRTDRWTDGRTEKVTCRSGCHT